LDVFWLKVDSLDSLAGLLPRHVMQQETIDHLEAAFAAFRDVAANLPESALNPPV
jgi:type I restriction enzyme M protein